MRNKIILIALVYVCFITIASTFSSCFLIDEVSICDVQFRGQGNGATVSPPDTLIKHIAFTISAQRGNQTCNIWQSLNPISSCYATSKGTKWLNDLDTSTFELRLDSSIAMNNNIISADSNLLSNTTIKLFSTITKENISPHSVDYTIDFQDTLKSILVFTDRMYTVTFNCRTTDGRDIEQEAKIIFK